MTELVLPKLVILLSAVGVIGIAQADWISKDSSRIGSVSIKNNSIGENYAFERVSGSIPESGLVAAIVDLYSL